MTIETDLRTELLESWTEIQTEADQAVQDDPSLAGYFDDAVLTHRDLVGALARILARKLALDRWMEGHFTQLFGVILSSEPILRAVVRDLGAIRTRDPACSGPLSAFLNYKGFHALCGYRVAHQLWNEGKAVSAKMIQTQISEKLGLDIHPRAQIGSGIFIDHGTGIVIGETAVVEDQVSILHAVTLGGTGKGDGDRHPKVRTGVLIGAGAVILGNIEIGASARIGAGSVVLTSVPEYCTAVGVPARILPNKRTDSPALEMEHRDF